MADIGTEAEQRKQFITETEHRIAELEQQVEKGRDIDERIQRIKERRTVGRTSALDRGDTRRTRTERTAYRGTEDAAQRISDLEREIKQREQSREYSSIKERLEAGRQSILAILIEIKVIELYKKNCWDVITLLMILTSAAVIIYFGEVIKKALSINLLFFWLILQGIYLTIRRYISQDTD